MMRSLFSGVSGLKGHQTRMDVIGNNIANVNATGFKSSRVTFADTLSQTQSGASAPGDTIGGTNPKQIGLGTGVASIDLLFTDGSVQSTGKNTDLCLSGNGLFIVKSGNETYYTRDGAFEFDAAGNYVLPGNGLKVQGWVADGEGNLNTTGGVTDIVIGAGKSMPAEATTTATYENNLNASTKVIKAISGGNPSEYSITLSDGTVVTTETSYEVGDVYDTADVTVQYKKNGDTATINSNNSPLTVVLKDGTKHTIDVNSLDTSWKYGYTLTTASSVQSVNATADTSVTVYGGNNRSIDGVAGNTYKIGDIYTKEYSAADDVVIVGSADKSVVLTMSDGVTIDVTTAKNKSFAIGDTYTYPSGATATGTVSKIEVQFKASSIDVSMQEANGVSLMVGGFAENEVAAGTIVEGNANNTLVLTLADGSTVKVNDGSYKVGDSYASAPVTASGSSITANGSVKLFLDNGVEVEDTTAAGTVYKIGDTYTYTGTDSSGTTTTYTPKIVGYSTLTKINAIKTQGTIEEIDVTQQQDRTVTAVDITKSEAVDGKAITLTMSDGTTQTVTTGKYNVGNSLPLTTIINVYDSLGVVHAVPVYFTKTQTGTGETVNDGNQWTVTVDGNDVTGTTNTITEDDGSVTTVTMNPVTLQFSTSGALLDGSGSIEFTLTDGANRTQTVAVDVSKITQFSGNSTIKASTDGNAMGTLKSVSVDSSGVITGTYTNGEKRSEAQVAVAQFNNASGLTKTGSSLYQVSNNSGDPNVKTATDLGCTITPSALEMSNVDIANEFSDMIITQRGFQSNSKVITVGDEMLETLINMKR